MSLLKMRILITSIVRIRSFVIPLNSKIIWESTFTSFFTIDFFMKFKSDPVSIMKLTHSSNRFSLGRFTYGDFPMCMIFTLAFLLDSSNLPVLRGALEGIYSCALPFRISLTFSKILIFLIIIILSLSILQGYALSSYNIDKIVLYYEMFTFCKLNR